MRGRRRTTNHRCALLATLDALNEKKIPLSVNLKVIFEGEEEAGSEHLQQTLDLHKNLLVADVCSPAMVRYIRPGGLSFFLETAE